MLAAIIPTYHPDEGFEQRLRRIRPQVDRLYLVDDGSPADVRTWLREIAAHLDTVLLEQPANLGVAAAFNRGCAAAQQAGCRLALLLDQDSIVGPDLVERMRAICPRLEEIDAAVLAANYTDATGRTVYRVPGSETIGPVTIAISSGSLVSLPIWQAVSGFDESLFIDEVDHDYCLRVQRHGHRVLATREPLMRHEVGSQRRYLIPGRGFSMSHHSPLRRYYMTRNRAIMVRRYLTSNPRWVGGMVLRSVAEMALVPILEPDGWAKARAITLGLMHGLTGRTGRLEPREWMTSS